MDKEPSPDAPEVSRLQRFWHELKRRNLVRVATVYAIVGWLIIQVANATFAEFGIPPWAYRFVVLMVLLGFPLSLILAWAFELTPTGIRVTPPAPARAQRAPASPELKRRRTWVSMAFAAALPTLIFGALALFFYLRSGSPKTDRAPTPRTEVPRPAVASIAVMPLINMSANPDNAFFAGGVHEDILTNLSRLEGVKVISRTSVMRYLGSDLSLPEIGAELGVRYIVEGSVRRINNFVRVSVQLIDAGDDTHLWASNYDRELIDVFATQSAVSKEISNSLHLVLQPDSVGTLEGMPTHSVRAYDLYLKALSINRSEIPSESNYARQREFLEAAVQEDPDFVEAWAYLNDIYDTIIRLIIQRGWYIPDGSDQATVIAEFGEKAAWALQKALALDPDNVATRLAAASDFIAEREAQFRADRKQVLDELLILDPENAMLWYTLGWWYASESDPDPADEAFRRALELDPLHAQIVEGALNFYHLLVDEAMITMLFERLVQIAPEKREDTRLGRAAPGRAFEALGWDLAQTADETLIATMVTLLERSVGSFSTPLEELGYEAALLEIQNDQAGLRALERRMLAGEPWIDAATERQSIDEYTIVQHRFMWLHLLSDDKVQALGAAERILGATAFLLDEPGRKVRQTALESQILMLRGEDERARKILSELLEGEWVLDNPAAVTVLLSVALVDPDRLAKLVFAAMEAVPYAPITDFHAINHILFRASLRDPKVHAHLLKEAKWIDFLAARVPEYAQDLESP